MMSDDSRGRLDGEKSRSERGATLPLVALTLVALLGVVSLVVDLGYGWLTRRVLVAATDAAALAAAQDFATGSDGCATAAAAYLAANDEAASLDACLPYAYDAVDGRVVVAASRHIEPGFSAALGQGDLTVDSFSAALWGPPTAVSGLRPIGICYHASDGLRRVIDDPTPATETIVVWSATGTGGDCEGSSSNWAALDFAGGSSGRAQIAAWTVDGYPEPVPFSPHPIDDCDVDEHCQHGWPSSLRWLESELDGLRRSGVDVTFAVFDRAEQVDGATLFHVIGVVRARIVSFRLGYWYDWPYLELDIRPGVVTGVCCGDGDGAGGNRVVALCAVDADDLAGCAPQGS